MSEILLKAADARSVAADVKRSAAETTDSFESLRGRLAALGDSFRGESARAFDDRYNEWMTSAGSLIEALDGLGEFLNGAANSIEETDNAIASSLR